MTETLLVQQTDESSCGWKPVFDGNEGNRLSRRASEHRVLHDGIQLTILIDCPDRASAEGFVSDPALADAMSNAGVGGAPEIAFSGSSEQLRH